MGREVFKYFHAKERDRFWKTCLQIARDNPELSAEEVEFKAAQTMKSLRP